MSYAACKYSTFFPHFASGSSCEGTKRTSCGVASSRFCSTAAYKNALFKSYVTLIRQIFIKKGWHGRSQHWTAASTDALLAPSSNPSCSTVSRSNNQSTSTDTSISISISTLVGMRTTVTIELWRWKVSYSLDCFI